MFGLQRRANVLLRPVRRVRKVPRCGSVSFASVGGGSGVAVVGFGLAVTDLFQLSSFSFPDDLELLLQQLRHRAETTANGDSGSKGVTSLIAANCFVFGMWRIAFRSPEMTKFMFRHFTCSLTNIREGRLHTLLTSSFSQFEFLHLGFNMYALYGFGDALLSNRRSLWHSPDMSFTSFLSLYLYSGVTAAVASLASAKFFRNKIITSLGASGSIMGVLTYFCFLHPEQQILLFNMWQLGATDCLKLIAAVNCAGLAFFPGSGIDFSGHIGGHIGGYFYKLIESK